MFPTLLCSLLCDKDGSIYDELCEHKQYDNIVDRRMKTFLCNNLTTRLIPIQNNTHFFFSHFFTNPNPIQSNPIPIQRLFPQQTSEFNIHLIIFAVSPHRSALCRSREPRTPTANLRKTTKERTSPGLWAGRGSSTIRCTSV